jgi:hypothetical protein
MKIALLIGVSLALLSSLSYSQQAITDGPYVFYRNGMVYVKRVITIDSGYRAVIDSFPEAGKTHYAVKVNVEGHSDWAFTIPLRSTIPIPPDSSTSRRKRRILVLSDIEGEFAAFRSLLLAAKVIDTKYRWTFGKGKLIIAGDLFDRGKQVSQFLWLLYKLEDEAARHRGQVHVVLGNHDIMNLSGDFRYVQAEYGASCSLMGEHYYDLYGPDTELGRWLRSHNTIEKVDGLLILHGGVSPQMLSLHRHIADINNSCRPWYDKTNGSLPDSLKLFFGDAALFWYRGYFIGDTASTAQVDSTLAFYGADRIIVGHDIIDHIAPFYDGKVIGVDVNEHEGTHEALLIEKEKFYRLDEKGAKMPLNP